MRNFVRILIVAFLAGCSKRASPPPAPQPVAIQQAQAAARPVVTVKQLVVTPETVHRGQPVTATVELASPGASTPVQLNWFDPSGWSVLEETREANGGRVSFTAPGDRFEEPGTYRAAVRTGGVYQAQATFTVAG